MSAVRIGVIGYGYWGPNIVRNLVRPRGLRGGVAVCDRNPKALAKAQAHLSRPSASRPRPPRSRRPRDRRGGDRHAGVDALRAGEGRARARQARLRREAVHVHVGTGRGAHRARRPARTCGSWWTTPSSSPGPCGRSANWSTTGTLGPLLYFDSSRVNLGLFQHDVSVIWDLAPHDLAIMDHVIGKEPEAVVATGSTHFGQHADIAFVTIVLPRQRHRAHQRQLALAGEGADDDDRRPRQDAGVERRRGGREDQDLRQGRDRHERRGCVRPAGELQVGRRVVAEGAADRGAHGGAVVLPGLHPQRRHAVQRRPRGSARGAPARGRRHSRSPRAAR